MSKLSFMEKLLDGVQVKWVPLGKLTSLITKGTTPKSYAEGGVSFIKIENILNGNVSLEKNFCISEEIHSGELRRSILQKNDILFAIAGSIGKCTIVDEAILPANTNQALAIIRLVRAVDTKFVFHFLHTKSMKDYIEKFNKTSAQPNLNLRQMSDFKIPIPCPNTPKKSLEIQAEIVRILDAFTAMTAELTSELTAELNMRKQQYNHYRDQLLSFKEGEVEWRTLGEVFDIFAGGDKPKDAFSKKETEEFNVPILSNGIGIKSLYGWTNVPRVTKPSLTVSARGTIGWTSYRDSPFFPIIRLIVLTPKIKLNTKYAYYYMKTIEKNYPVPPAGIPQLTKPMVENVQFPIPFANDPEKSLAEQARIVAILDKFDALTHSITEGLPREIELREKQYEYYRDRLLSFPEPTKAGTKPEAAA